jgi:hypothetical protein
MSTPKNKIKKIEAKAKKSSIQAKNHPVMNDDDGDVINMYAKKPIKEANTIITAGPYTGPIEIGMTKWKDYSLKPFTEFVDTEINHKKIKSSLKNNIKKVVGMWEKLNGTYNMDNHYVHTVNEWHYEEAPILTEDLAVWFGTKKKPKGSKQPKGPWVDICRKVDGKHPPCGRSDADTKSYPKCRAVGVAGKMSDSEKKAACAQKRRAEKKEPKYGTGNLPTMTSYKPKKGSKMNESQIVKMLLKEAYDYPKFSVKNGKIVIDDRYTYQLQGYSSILGWVDIPVVNLTKSGESLVMKYKKPPIYNENTDTIKPDSIQYIKNNLGKMEIEPPVKEGKPRIRLTKK